MNTPQHPAAPETDANGLTEAEHDAISEAARIDDNCGDLTGIIAAVERIVAERVRVVEGERTKWERLAMGTSMAHDTATARAESAEAAREAEKAAHERLRAEIEEKIAQYSRLAGQAMDPECREWLIAFVGTLRSLLGGGEAR